MFMRALDGRQLTAARALTELTVAQLAEAADVTPRTIHRLEIGGVIPISPKKRHGHVSRAVLDRIINALDRHGVELVPEIENQGAGVRWKMPRAARKQ